MAGSLNIHAFRSAARAAFSEAELNGLKNRDNTEAQDEFWEQFQVLEEIALASSAQASQNGAQGRTGGPEADGEEEPLEGEVVN